MGSTTIFIKNLPWSAVEDEIYEFFKECGEAVNVRIGKRPTLLAAWHGRCCQLIGLSWRLQGIAFSMAALHNPATVPITVGLQAG